MYTDHGEVTTGSSVSHLLLTASITMGGGDCQWKVSGEVSVGGVRGRCQGEVSDPVWELSYGQHMSLLWASNL